MGHSASNSQFFFNRWPEKGTLTLFVFVLATDKDMCFVAGVMMVLSLAHGGAAPQFLSKRMYPWIRQGYSDVRSTVELADFYPEQRFTHNCTT